MICNVSDIKMKSTKKCWVWCLSFFDRCFLKGHEISKKKEVENNREVWQVYYKKEIAYGTSRK
jgi:hypothetical protein